MTQITLLDGEIHASGPYTAQPLPWSIDVLPGCRNLRPGVDFRNTMRFDARRFPAGVEISWTWPDHMPDGGFFWGYNYVALGNYNGSQPPAPVHPVQLGDLKHLEAGARFKLGSGSDGHNILCDMFVTSEAGEHLKVTGEVGVLLHVGSDDLLFLERGERVGVFSGPEGDWGVFDTGANPMGAPYYVFVPEPVRTTAGPVDLAPMLHFLVTMGRLDARTWINGLAIGVEPHRGSGAVDLLHLTLAWPVS